MYKTGMSILDLEYESSRFVLFTTHIKIASRKSSDIEMRLIRYSKDKNYVKWGIELGTNIVNYLFTNNITDLGFCFEGKAYTSFKTGNFDEFTGAVKAILFKTFPSSPIYITPINTIKKFATGNGRASKQDMISAFIKDNNIDPVVDDIADSYYIAKYIQCRGGH